MTAVRRARKASITWRDRIGGTTGILRIRLGDGVRFASSVATRDRAFGGKIADAATEIVEVLCEAGRPAEEIDRVLRRLAECRDARAIATVTEAARILAADRRPAARTFGDVADAWVSGELARLYPDHVAEKSAAKDAQILRRYLGTIRDVPIEAFSLDDADRAMALLPSTSLRGTPLSKASRRHVAQVINRVLNLAAYPMKLITVSPIPRRWLPGLGSPKAFGYLYPREEEALLRCWRIPLERRLFWGLLSREGLRVTEALDLSWDAIDLEHGVIRLDENKTDDPRSWALGEDVLEALRRWRDLSPAEPFGAMSGRHVAVLLRADLIGAGITRAELHETSGVRRPLRAHDLRATFVTLALAAGRSETWVRDRTGHTTTTMIDRYRRAARTASELRLGWLCPLGVVFQDEGGIQMGSHRRWGKVAKRVRS